MAIKKIFNAWLRHRSFHALLTNEEYTNPEDILAFRSPGRVPPSLLQYKEM